VAVDLSPFLARVTLYIKGSLVFYFAHFDEPVGHSLSLVEEGRERKEGGGGRREEGEGGRRREKEGEGGRRLGRGRREKEGGGRRKKEGEGRREKEGEGRGHTTPPLLASILQLLQYSFKYLLTVSVKIL
jgi:hypothetical protein